MRCLRLKLDIYQKEGATLKSTSDKGPRYVLIGSQLNCMEYITSKLKGATPHLIILNISNYIYKIAVKTKFRVKKENLGQLEQGLIKLDDSDIREFVFQLSKILETSYSKLSNAGYFAVITNGTTKYHLKRMLDLIYHRDNFINEIIIDSPYQIFYTEEIPVFERTNYILLYSKKNDQK